MERVYLLFWHQNQRINNHIIIGETTYSKHIITDDHSWCKQILVGLKLYKGQTKPYNLKAICLCWDTVGMLDWFAFQQDVLLELESSVFLVPREKIKLLRPDLRSKCPNRTRALKATEVLTSCDAIQSWLQWRGCNIVSLAVTLLPHFLSDGKREWAENLKIRHMLEISHVSRSPAICKHNRTVYKHAQEVWCPLFSS